MATLKKKSTKYGQSQSTYYMIFMICSTNYMNKNFEVLYLSNKDRQFLSILSPYGNNLRL